MGGLFFLPIFSVSYPIIQEDHGKTKQSRYPAGGL